jgi:osmotically-inducible protein OsmY
MRDSEVEQQVLRSLMLDSAIVCREICVESQAGVVTLSGKSPSRHMRSAIQEATRRTPGVCGVVNKIEVERGACLTAEIPAGASTSVPPLNQGASA